MAIVIDALKLVRDKKGLPTEAFFVDTNIVIDYTDPFGQSLDLHSLARRNERITEALSYLKSRNNVAYGSVGVALEYYKHIQVGFYQVHTGAKFNSDDFKQLRDNDIDFMNRWDGQMKAFKRVFTKNFPLYDSPTSFTELLPDFQGSSCDFGDHLLFATVMQRDPKMRSVFSNDMDFYSFPDSLFLLTTNQKLVQIAEGDKKLFDSLKVN